MTPPEVVDVLTAIASFDLRTIGQSDVVAWHAVIGDLDKALALEAVVIHHKTSTDRIKPAHVIGIARSIKRDRMAKNVAAENHVAVSTHAIGPAYHGLPINVEGDPVWAAYDVNDAGSRECPRCHALPDGACVTSRDTAQRIPCLERMKPRAPKGPMGGRS